jgi:[ribosomal protein S5]-alanine N-acetyltransferase
VGHFGDQVLSEKDHAVFDQMAHIGPSQPVRPALFNIRSQGTFRFRLRPLSSEDFPEFARIRALKQVAEFLPGGQLDCRQAAQIAEWVVEESAKDWLAWGIGLSAIVEGPGDQFIGYCGLHWIDSVGKFEICYMLSPDFWGRGLATICVCAVMEHVETHRICEEVIALVSVDNVRSKRVLLRNGFAHRSNISDGLTKIEYFVRASSFDGKRSRR